QRVLAQLIVRPADVVVSLRVVGLEGERALVGVNRLLVLLGVVEIDIAEAEIGRGVIALERHGLCVSLDGVFVAAELAVGKAELILGFGIIVLLEHGLVERDERLLVTPEVVEGPAELVISLGVLGVEANRLAVGGDGL